MGKGQISDLGEAPRGRFLISDQGSVLSSLLNYTGGFREVRVKCTKTWHGRVVHAVLKGDYVLKALIENTPKYGLCESDLRFLHDDTSLMKDLDCTHLNIGYNTASLYDHLLYGNNRHVLLGAGDGGDRFECDDKKWDGTGYTDVGSWTYFIR